MAYYYKVSDGETVTEPPLQGIQVYDGNEADGSAPCINYDFSKHVLIELLDNVTPEAKLWAELGLADDKSITHKRMIVDPHRVNCRRAVVVCSSSEEAKELTQRLSQAKIMKRSICAVVIQELLSDIILFEKQIMQYGDKRSQHQLVYVTELTRRREPSGLAQYLREKFSPCGTILNVFVSEDKDGYAYPEGVIKFAYLSEAFAAELAYDQCAVALERLSVSTHHNILLSQCDLRARLREAYSRHSSEFSLNVVSPESQIKQMPSDHETDSDQTKILPSNNFKVSVRDSTINESVLNDSTSTVDGNNEFPTDSAELSDVLKKPCESNLVDCLQSIARFSESTASRRTSANSFAETEPRSESALPVSANNSFSPPLNKTWSSRIMGWITDLPNIDPSSQVDAKEMTENGVPILESTALTGKDKNLECNQLTNPMDVVSSTCSFVTCNNGELNSSFNSIPASPVDNNDSQNVTLVEDKNFYYSEVSDEENSNANGSMWESKTKSNDSHVLSLKRKNSSMMTQKLSLKYKRKHNSQTDSVGEVLDGETTLHLPPSTPKTRKCHVVLNSVPELDQIAKNLSFEQKPVVVLERLSSSQSVDGSVKIEVDDVQSITQSKTKSKKHSKKGIDDSSSSVRSQPIRRSNRLTSRSSNKTSNTLSNSMENGAKPSVSSDNCAETLSDGTESPLRLWLRKELDASTNNQVSRNKESTKSIVCATTNKDVLISVGCSHMTCDFCYPDSTKLLLGFH